MFGPLVFTFDETPQSSTVSCLLSLFPFFTFLCYEDRCLSESREVSDFFLFFFLCLSAYVCKVNREKVNWGSVLCVELCVQVSVKRERESRGFYESVQVLLCCESEKKRSQGIVFVVSECVVPFCVDFGRERPRMNCCLVNWEKKKEKAER